MAARMFTLPFNPQTGSGLLQLPLEIRMIILRLFLVQSNDELESPADLQRRMDQCVGWRVLRTCQALYNEGMRIFYNQNRLDLVVDYDANQPNPIISIRSNMMSFKSNVDFPLNVICPIPEDFSIDSDEFDIVETLTTKPFDVDDESRDRFVDVLKQFTRVELDLTKCRNDHSRVLAIVVRLLEPLVRGNHLVIKYDLGTTSTFELGCCKQLNCASLRIISQFNTQEVAQFVQSWTPNQGGVDTYGDFCLVYSGTLHELPRRDIGRGENSLVDEYSDEMAHFERHALACDAATCSMNLSRIDSMIIEWTRNWWVDKSSDLQLARHKMERAVKISDGIVDHGANSALSDRVKALTKWEESPYFGRRPST